MIGAKLAATEGSFIPLAEAAAVLGVAELGIRLKALKGPLHDQVDHAADGVGAIE